MIFYFVLDHVCRSEQMVCCVFRSGWPAQKILPMQDIIGHERISCCKVAYLLLKIRSLSHREQVDGLLCSMLAQYWISSPLNARKAMYSCNFFSGRLFYLPDKDEASTVVIWNSWFENYAWWYPSGTVTDVFWTQRQQRCLFILLSSEISLVSDAHLLPSG